VSALFIAPFIKGGRGDSFRLPEPKTKKRVPSLRMELPLPSGAANLSTARQVFWLSDQPENVSLPTGVINKSPTVAGNCLNVFRPRFTAAGPPRIHTGFRIAWGLVSLGNY